jgi:hypothetical protein
MEENLVEKLEIIQKKLNQVKEATNNITRTSPSTVGDGLPFLVKVSL